MGRNGGDGAVGPSPGWQRVDGVLVQGHQVASGRNPRSPYPGGTIALQQPFFRQLGLDLSGLMAATLNVSVHPHRVHLRQPEYTFRQVAWSDRHPPEDFSFTRCQVVVNQTPYDGWIYYPHPETKQRHFQADSLIEVIAPPIPHLAYGIPLQIRYNPQAVELD